MPPVTFTKEDHLSLKIPAYIISIRVELASSSEIYPIYWYLSSILPREIRFEMTTRIL